MTRLTYRALEFDDRKRIANLWIVQLDPDHQLAHLFYRTWLWMSLGTHLEPKGFDTFVITKKRKQT